MKEKQVILSLTPEEARILTKMLDGAMYLYLNSTKPDDRWFEVVTQLALKVKSNE